MICRWRTELAGILPGSWASDRNQNARTRTTKAVGRTPIVALRNHRSFLHHTGSIRRMSQLFVSWVTFRVSLSGVAATFEYPRKSRPPCCRRISAMQLRRLRNRRKPGSYLRSTNQSFVTVAHRVSRSQVDIPACLCA